MSHDPPIFGGKVRLNAGFEWPSGEPVSSEPLGDGRVKHTLEDGMAFTVSKPTYRLDYLSTWASSKPGDTYEVNIAIVGLCEVPGFYTCWNFDINERRSYSFKKTVRIVHLETAEMFTGEELEESLREQGVLAYVKA